MDVSTRYMRRSFATLLAKLVRGEIQRNRTERIGKLPKLSLLNDRTEAGFNRAFNGGRPKSLLCLSEEPLVNFDRGFHVCLQVLSTPMF